MKPQFLIASALLLVSTVVAFTLHPNEACAGGRCGSCYNTGRPGFLVVNRGIQDCVPCNQAEYQSPYPGGPGRTSGRGGGGR